MFDYTAWERKHHTAREGEQLFEQWKRDMLIMGDGFDFKINTGRHDAKGFKVYLNVESWGFYQGSDWAWYIFISYRTSDHKTTVAYHWDVDQNGKATGTPRVHTWNN